MADPILQSEVSRPDVATANNVLSHFGLSPQTTSIELPSSARGFSGALVLRVEAGDQSYCLRRWPHDGLPPQRLSELHRFLRDLGESGIGQIAVPLHALNGESLVESAGNLWQLEPWMPGTADFHRSPTQERLRSAMQTLARLHRASQAYECPRSGLEWFGRYRSAPSPACRERLVLLRDWTAARRSLVKTQLAQSAPSEFVQLGRDILMLFGHACRSIERELRTLHEVPFPLHPCLRDVWHDHLLFIEDDLTGLIDPSAARTENVAADLSRLLGSLVGDDRTLWDFALNAYNDVRPLSIDEHQLIAALDRSGVLLSGMTWIDRFVSGKLPTDDLPRIVPRLTTIRDRLETLTTTSRT